MPIFSHGVEGFALDWSPVHHAGDNKSMSGNHLRACVLVKHSSSVEDLHLTFNDRLELLCLVYINGLVEEAVQGRTGVDPTMDQFLAMVGGSQFSWATVPPEEIAEECPGDAQVFDQVESFTRHQRMQKENLRRNESHHS
ncbi:hypothetical protein SELMODRAFT_403098 [Selaginella moellendorffii]|uniref:Uncharacterized protein n=1 Tax=Selaginella moellendorffii TaxID=88036 RepID=D8QP15_SELML|nr:hypothetical protein SELMODRAFT_403098 [Selaginella moellendorffii]